MSKVEQVADAILASRQQDPPTVAGIRAAGHNQVADNILRDAVAAIEAMRKLTPEMFKAGGAPINGNTQAIWALHEQWQAMIDAALDTSVCAPDTQEEPK